MLLIRHSFSPSEPGGGCEGGSGRGGGGGRHVAKVGCVWKREVGGRVERRQTVHISEPPTIPEEMQVRLF